MGQFNYETCIEIERKSGDWIGLDVTISYTVLPGHKGSRNEPPEGPEIEDVEVSYNGIDLLDRKYLKSHIEKWLDKNDYELYDNIVSNT